MIRIVDEGTNLHALYMYAWLSVGFGPVVDIVAYGDNVKELIEYGSERYGFGPDKEDWHVVPDPIMEFPSEFPEEAREFGYI